MAKKKTCFVIAPIGAPDSPERKWSDTIFEHIIKPSVEADYKPIRADQIEQSGLVTAQIVDQLLNADLTIADLTDGNPNVYYEVAIRHAVKKPIVHLIRAGQTPRFDIQGMRAVHVDDSLGIGKNAIESIKAQIKTLESDPNSLTTPVSQAINLAELNKSNSPMDQFLKSLDDKVTRALTVTTQQGLHQKQPGIDKREILIDTLLGRFRKLLVLENIKVLSWGHAGNKLIIQTDIDASHETIKRIEDMAGEFDFVVQIGPFVDWN